MLYGQRGRHGIKPGCFLAGKKNMKLVIDGQVFSWWARGGIRSVYSQILPRVQQLAPDWDVRLAVQRSRFDENTPPLGCKVDEIPSLPVGMRPWRLWSKVGPFVDRQFEKAYWARTSMDVFHPTYYHAAPKGVPNFVFVYDMIIELFPEWFQDPLSQRTKAQKARCVQGADLILCISENTKKDVIRLLGAPEEKCKVVYLGGLKDHCKGVDLTAKVQFDRPFFLYVGDFGAPYKNFEFLLRSLGSPCCARFRDMKLIVVASRDPSEAERNYYDQLLGPGRLRVVKGCTDQELAAYYASCSCFIYPSLYEGFGIPVLEALGVGAPVACSHAASLPEVGGDAVYYFDPQSQEEFCRAVESALLHGRAKNMLDIRINQAQRFSWDETARGFVDAAAALCDES